MSGSDPTRRFSDRVGYYVRSRPGYPTVLVDRLEQATGLAVGPDCTIADVGSGTGLSSGMFLARGATVFAVEPNAEMRRAAESAWGGDPNFRSLDGRSEATTLPPTSVDLVVAGQAFHWFDRPATRREFANIARPPGWVALFWNTRRAHGSAFSQGYERLIAEFGTDYRSVRHENIDAAELAEFYGNGNFTTMKFDNRQTVDADGFRARLLSSSYLPGDGHPRREAMLAAADRLFTDHQSSGHVEIEYDTELYVGTLG